MSIKGINLQGCVRRALHKGYSYTRMIERCSAVVVDLNADSVRIGGTPMEGARFNAGRGGYGRTGERVFDPYNYPIAMLDVAQEAGLEDVFISLHSIPGNGAITEADIDNIKQLCDSRSITSPIFSLDNEQYTGKRTREQTFSYELMGQMAGWLEDRGLAYVWPLKYAHPREEANVTQRRGYHTPAMVSEMNKRPSAAPMEVHLYCPKGEDAEMFLLDALASTKDSISQLENRGNFIVGEWSGKNQETFSDQELESVIDTFLGVFGRANIRHYYQLLGSDNPGDYRHGLWNFETDSPNAGYQVFKDA